MHALSILTALLPGQISSKETVQGHMTVDRSTKDLQSRLDPISTSRPVSWKCAGLGGWEGSEAAFATPFYHLANAARSTERWSDNAA